MSSKPVLKIGNGSIQTGNGIISPTSVPPIKIFFNKMFLTFTNDFQTSFENRKRIHPNKKWNYFSYLLTSNQKPLLQNVSNFSQRFQNQFLMGNGFIQTGNGISL